MPSSSDEGRGIRGFLQTIDHVLRGRFTAPDDLHAGRLPLPLGSAVRGALILGAVYGLFMGAYVAFRGDAHALQLLAAAVKVPLLFVVTSAVTIPSLYVVSVLAGSPLSFTDTLRLMWLGILVHLALLASLGPVIGFFTLSTESYPFMVLLNVAFFGVSGFVGIAATRRAVDALLGGRSRPAPATIAPAASESATTTPPPPPRSIPSARTSSALRVFSVWTLVYGAVGAQTGWILRPFIGTPDLPFTWFRERQSNFFEAVIEALRVLFS